MEYHEARVRIIIRCPFCTWKIIRTDRSLVPDAELRLLHHVANDPNHEAEFLNLRAVAKRSA
jgi:hypothetical protein